MNHCSDSCEVCQSFIVIHARAHLRDLRERDLRERDLDLDFDFDLPALSADGRRLRAAPPTPEPYVHPPFFVLRLPFLGIMIRLDNVRYIFVRT
jgi:hypothetical protein